MLDFRAGAPAGLCHSRERQETQHTAAVSGLQRDAWVAIKPLDYSGASNQTATVGIRNPKLEQQQLGGLPSVQLLCATAAGCRAIRNRAPFHRRQQLQRGRSLRLLARCHGAQFKKVSVSGRPPSLSGVHADAQNTHWTTNEDLWPVGCPVVAVGMLTAKMKNQLCQEAAI